MAERDNQTLEAVRINSRQTIIVAVVTGLVSIVTTLIATGNLPGGQAANHTAGDVGESASNFAVLNAPELHFSTIPIDLSLDECMIKADDDLKELELTGTEEGRYIRWGYDNDTTGLIWCHTDEALAIFLAAGTNATATSDLAEALRKSF